MGVRISGVILVGRFLLVKGSFFMEGMLFRSRGWWSSIVVSWRFVWRTFLMNRVTWLVSNSCA